MVVYIEYAFIDNLIINYVLLACSTTCAKIKTKPLYLILSSLLGTVVALIVPLVDLNGVLLVFLKLTLGALMVYISGRYVTLKKYIITFSIFLAFTFLCGGFLIAVFSFAGIDYKVYFNLNYDSAVPIGLSVLIVYAVCKVLVKVAFLLLKERALRPFIRSCVVIINGQKFKTQGFIDSGNGLYEKRSGLPVVVASKPLYEKLIMAGVKKNSTNLEFDTVSGTSTMELYIIDKLLIYNGISVNILNNVLLGVSKVTQNFNGYELLLHPALEI